MYCTFSEWVEAFASDIRSNREYTASKQGMHWCDGRGLARVDAWDGEQGGCRGELGENISILSGFTRYPRAYQPQPGDIIDCEFVSLSYEKTVSVCSLHEPAKKRISELDRALQQWRDVGLGLPKVTLSNLLDVPFSVAWNAETAAATFVGIHGPVFKQTWVPVLAQQTFTSFEDWLGRQGLESPSIDLEDLIAKARNAAEKKKVSSASFMANQVYLKTNADLDERGAGRSFLRIANSGHPLADSWILISTDQATRLSNDLDLKLEAPRKTSWFRFWN